MSQAAIARALGLSPALVCRYRKRGMPVDDPEAARAWHRANIVPKARATTAPPPEQPEPAAAGAQGERLDLAQERALLIRAQRLEVENRLRVADKTFASVQTMAAVMAAAATAFSERLDHLPAMLRRTHPDLAADALDAIVGTISEARTNFTDAVAELMTERVLRGEFDPTTDDGESDEEHHEKTL